MTIAIPVVCRGGSINTATSGRVTISELGTSTNAVKLGSGTLRIASGSQCNWVIRDGVLEVDPEALSRVEIRDWGVLRLVDDSLIRRLSAMDGTVDLDGHTLVLEEGLVYGRIVGDGTVRFVGRNRWPSRGSCRSLSARWRPTGVSSWSTRISIPP